MEGSQLWYKPHRLLGSCGVCDTLVVTRLRLVTPRVYVIHHSFLGVYLTRVVPHSFMHHGVWLWELHKSFAYEFEVLWVLHKGKFSRAEPSFSRDVNTLAILTNRLQDTPLEGLSQPINVNYPIGRTPYRLFMQIR